MDAEAINTFCGTTAYKQRALHKRDVIDEQEKTNKNLSNWDFNVYPNPNTGIFEVQFAGSNEDVYLEVLDAFGRVVQ